MATRLGWTNEAMGQSNVQSKLDSKTSPFTPPPASSNPFYSYIRPISMFKTMVFHKFR